VHHQPVTEHVPHDDQVGLLVLHAHAVHAQELGEQRAAVTLHYVLEEEPKIYKLLLGAKAMANGSAGSMPGAEV